MVVALHLCVTVYRDDKFCQPTTTQLRSALPK
jgi:hypothetical protein